MRPARDGYALASRHGTGLWSGSRPVCALTLYVIPYEPRDKVGPADEEQRHGYEKQDDFNGFQDPRMIHLFPEIIIMIIVRQLSPVVNPDNNGYPERQGDDQEYTRQEPERHGSPDFPYFPPA